MVVEPILNLVDCGKDMDENVRDIYRLDPEEDVGSQYGVGCADK